MRTLKDPARKAAMGVGHQLIAPAQIAVRCKKGHEPKMITLLNVERPFAHLDPILAATCRCHAIVGTG